MAKAIKGCDNCMSEQIRARVLIIDDSDSKAADIRAVWVRANGEQWSELEHVKSIHGGLAALRGRFFDLLVLDLKIPRRDGDLPDEREAKRLLEDLNDTPDLRPPREVVVLSAFADTLASEASFYEDRGWTSLLYDTGVDEWREKLLAKFGHIATCVRAARGRGRSDFEKDYCILSALRTPELEPVLRLAYDWQSTELLDSTEFYVGSCVVNGAHKTVVCGSAFRMGMVHSSLLTAKAWHYFRPEVIILVGITAGVAGTSNFGDVLIAEEVWDYGAGKIADNPNAKQTFLPDPRHVNAPHSLVEALWSFGQKKEVRERIESSWKGKAPATHLAVIKGPVASGSAVVASKALIDGILGGNRKLIGLEMEAYGVYSACEYLPRPRPRFICVKSVCDFANSEKHDDWQHYAAFTSTEFVRAAIEAGIFLER